MSNNSYMPDASMMNNSETLDREEWLQVAADLLQVGPYIKASFENVVEHQPEAVEMVPGLDPDTFEANIRAACAAISYVAEFAADKCRFIVIKEE